MTATTTVADSSSASTKKPTRAELLKVRSIWDEVAVLSIPGMRTIHAQKIWKYLIFHCKDDSLLDLSKLPYELWSVPKSVRIALSEQFQIFTTSVEEASDSDRKDTTKLLLKLSDGHRIETVVIRHPAHSTVCVSSQIGCKMGCRFCATGKCVLQCSYF